MKGKYIAVSGDWLIQQYSEARDAIRNGSYEFDSPLANDLSGVNPSQIFDCTLSELIAKGILVEATQDFENGKCADVFYLTPFGLGEYLSRN